jgi:hypothetical protein
MNCCSCEQPARVRRGSVLRSDFHHREAGFGFGA